MNDNARRFRGEVDWLRVELGSTTNPDRLRDALESTLDYLDRVALDPRTQDGVHIATYVRRLIRKRLAGQGDFDVIAPPEAPSE